MCGVALWGGGTQRVLLVGGGGYTLGGVAPLAVGCAMGWGHPWVLAVPHPMGQPENGGHPGVGA